MDVARSTVHRILFRAQAAAELNLKEEEIRHDLGSLLRKLEELQETVVDETLREAKNAMASEDEQEALALLKHPQLLDRILIDFTRCGVVGEETNKLIGYLAATSRKLASPLAVMVQSSSAPASPSKTEIGESTRGTKRSRWRPGTDRFCPSGACDKRPRLSSKEAIQIPFITIAEK
jgi:hypothetical protein